MRMHPRLKARRGRFGAGGLTGWPTLSISAPGGQTTFGPGSPATIGNFTAVASDDLDGDISANVVWHVQGLGSPSAGLPGGSPDTGVATGASVDLSASLPVAGSPGGPANYTVIATVTDSGGNRATRTLSITVV